MQFYHFHEFGRDSLIRETLIRPLIGLLGQPCHGRIAMFEPSARLI